MHVTRLAGRLPWRYTVRFINNAIYSHSKMPPTIKVDDALIDSTGMAILNFLKFKFSFVGRCLHVSF